MCDVDDAKTTSMLRDGGEDTGKGNSADDEIVASAVKGGVDEVTKRKPGSPKKGVKTSPCKVSNNNPNMYCKCEVFIAKEVSVECDTCGQFWHLSCVGLKGLTEEMAKSLERWDCPNCFVCLYSNKTTHIMDSSALIANPTCGTIKIMIQEE